VGGRTFTTLEPVEHPVSARTRDREQELFVNPGFTTRIKGVSRKESDTLLRFLYEHMATPEYVVRYRWKAGDLGFWTTARPSTTPSRLRHQPPGHPAGDAQGRPSY